MEVNRNDLAVVIFSETLRMRMQDNKPPLIRHRRPLFKGYPNVFVGSEVVVWAVRNLLCEEDFGIDQNGNGTEIPNGSSNLSENQVVGLYQKLMDAGLLRNVQTMESFGNDKSLYRFSSDEEEADRFVRSVAIGFRLHKSAKYSSCNIFQKVCAYGELVSAECMKSADIVSWLVKSGIAASRQTAISLGGAMVQCKVLKPVDSDVTEFADGKAFYVFAVDFTSTSLTARQFLNSSIAERESSDSTSSNETTSRNARIHLRQTSENLLDLSHMTIQTPATQTTLRKKGPSTSSDDSGFNDNGPNSPPTYQSLLSRDGSMTKEALLHPLAPFTKRDLWIHPDPVGYGFVIRGTGPCYVKIVDPDSPAGRAGLKASQYIIDINGNSVVELPHAGIEDLILNGPKKLKITIMQPTDTITDKRKHSPPNSNNFLPPTPIKVRSAPLLPSAQPWMKTKENNAYKNVSQAMHRVVT
ncbi:DEP domain-containing mTOR-interacting protein-like [Clavelina lepadiformis]|uniref:DEP domain-containing mTOR-interacting protein-like n=1 Tax=Clavelina lepadiformis TaxID=159417 RepID=UPI00404127C9